MNTSRRQRPGRAPRKIQSATRLQAWLDTNHFTSAELEALTRVSRQSMTKIRAGADVRRKTMLRILITISQDLRGRQSIGN